MSELESRDRIETQVEYDDIITPFTLVKFLFGNARAILTVAQNRCSLPIAFVFVLSAGLAREYDGEDLIHEPWHALIPVVASLATALLLFAVVRFFMAFRGIYPFTTLREQFWAFLSAFWMMAPMAWLYAIPFHKFTDPITAIQMNLDLLALVALWRVALIIRVMQVLYGLPLFQLSIVVSAYGIALLAIGIFFVPVALLEVMGGIRHVGIDLVIQSYVRRAFSTVVLYGPFLWVAAMICAVFLRATVTLPRASRGSSSRAMKLLLLVSVLFWLPILPFTQPEQILRWETSKLFKEGKTKEALVFMSAHEREDYPALWQPPPRIVYREKVPNLDDVLVVFEGLELPSWVAEAYAEKVWTVRTYFFRQGRSLSSQSHNDVQEGSEEHKDLQVKRSSVVRKCRFLLKHYRPIDEDTKTKIEKLISDLVKD